MAIDWRQGMRRTYELVRLNGDWTEAEKVQDLTDLTITYEGKGLRYSAKFTPYEEVGDGYYRAYMVCTQHLRSGTESERVPLATFRVQSPSTSMDGRARTWKAVGYSPLVELDSDYPPIGWTAQGTVVAQAEAIAARCAAPCSYPASDASMAAWTADDGDTWLDCLEAVLAKASMHVEVDGMGRILFVPDPTGNESPVWTFDDAAYGLPSILAPDVDDSTDYYDLANKVEVVYSDEMVCHIGSAVNDDPLSRGSTVSRGYVNAVRDTSPEIDEPVTLAKVQAHAEKLLAEQGRATHSASFTHAYVPDAAVGRTVRLDYTRMGYRADGRIVKQVLKCGAAALVDTDIEYEEALNA